MVPIYGLLSSPKYFHLNIPSIIGQQYILTNYTGLILSLSEYDSWTPLTFLLVVILCSCRCYRRDAVGMGHPDSKFHVAHMDPMGPMNLAIRGGGGGGGGGGGRGASQWPLMTAVLIIWPTNTKIHH